jgi:iron(III) transport system ATP-binding protein
MIPVIDVDGLTVRADGRPILDGVSVVVGPGEVVVLLGASGSGKTTLLRAALGFVTPDEGVVRVRGAVVSRPSEVVVPPEERNLGVVFQDLALWPHLTVETHLTFGLRARGLARAERAARARAMLGRLGLAGLESRRPDQLSTGERQRVAIARALVLEPDAILLDEPLASLDVLLRRDMLGLFRTLFGRGTGTSALYVTHDAREAVALADRIVVLHEGRVLQTGIFADLRARPASPFVQALVDDFT